MSLASLRNNHKDDAEQKSRSRGVDKVFAQDGFELCHMCFLYEVFYFVVYYEKMITYLRVVHVRCVFLKWVASLRKPPE